MKLSARNQLKGKVAGIEKGPVSSKVKIDVGNGMIITSTVTTETIEDLAFSTGDDVVAIIKASDVIIGK